MQIDSPTEEDKDIRQINEKIYKIYVLTFAVEMRVREVQIYVQYRLRWRDRLHFKEHKSKSSTSNHRILKSHQPACYLYLETKSLNVYRTII